MSVTASARGLRARPGLVSAIAYIGAAGMAAVDMQIVNVALPAVGRDYGASLSSVQWVVVGYALALAVVMPASGWIGDRFGTRRTFVLAMAAFTLASAMCGAAPSLGLLILARILQGLSGGLLTPAGTALLFRAFGPAERARIARWVIAPVIVGPTVAPLLGGVLTDSLSWRWVFFVNLPLGAVLTWLIARYLPEYHGETREPLDLAGLGASALGLTALLYAISEGSSFGWGSPTILVAAAVGILTLTWFTRRQLFRPHPVLDLGLLRDRLFRANVVVTVFSTSSFLGMLYLIPLFLQEARHQTPLSSGSTTFFEAVGVFIASQTLVRLYPRLGPRVLATWGGAGVAGILLWMSFDGAGASLWLIRAQMFLLGWVNGAVYLSIQSSVFTNISHGSTAHASSIYITARQAAIALGIAIFTAVVDTVSGSTLQRFHAAFLAGVLLAGAGTVAAAVLMHTEDARASMRAAPGT